ncbi:STAS domain-containing protein [Streptosporangium canum]|uniref:STAS domain-containing protein n=1 Tax=Streptosporangium canum TaxID=324952 RepID=UPI003430DC6A
MPDRHMTATVVTVSGDLDLDAAPALRRKLTTALNSHREVVLDLSEVEFMECAGLGALVHARNQADLAARLPKTLALILLNPLRAAEPLTPERFVRATAAWIEGATEQTALWDIGAVLSTTADAAGDDLTQHVLLQLPPGYDVLFGGPGPASVPARAVTT